MRSRALIVAISACDFSFFIAFLEALEDLLGSVWDISVDNLIFLSVSMKQIYECIIINLGESYLDLVSPSVQLHFCNLFVNVLNWTRDYSSKFNTIIIALHRVGLSTPCWTVCEDTYVVSVNNEEMQLVAVSVISGFILLTHLKRTELVLRD